jgi:hypothetical protein
METLIQIQNKHKFNTDKGKPTHNYLEYYDELFGDYRKQKINLLEIGVLTGESLKLWSEYFTEVNLYGIDIFTREKKDGTKMDIDYVSKNLEGYDIQLDIVDSCSSSKDTKRRRNGYLSQFKDGFFDIIIDDGQHNSESQALTYNNFKSKVSKDGIYIIEDIKSWVDGGKRAGYTHLQHLTRDIKNLEIIHEGKGDDILGIIRGENIK